MKKHYIRLTALIAALILIAFIFALGAYTYEAATKIMNEKMIIADSHVMAPNSAEVPDDNAIQKFYSDLKIKSFSQNDDIGFYGVAEFDENTKIESCNFILVYYFSDDGMDTLTEKRIIPVDDDFKYSRRWLNNVSIDAMCDKNFIFNGTISFQDNIKEKNVKYTIGDNKLASVDEAVPASEVYADHIIEADYYTFAATKYETKLNKEAKKRLEDVKAKLEKGYASKVYLNDGTYSYQINSNDAAVLDEKIKNGEYVVTRQKSLWTSFNIQCAYLNSKTENYYVTYLFHPLELAFRTHIFLYILSLLTLIIIEALAAFMMRKMYSNRMSYELMRQDLTRSIAHDLKTPLAVTKAYTENWEYIDEEDRPEYAEKLNAEVDNMAVMINNMLNMTKLDSEKDLKLEEVELYAMTSTIYERMKPIIAERGLKVKLITDIIGGKYYVNADPKMIKIAIGNFITNAVKYAESKVEIKLLGKDKKVTFMVTNDGEGISKKEIKRIWEPFYKTDKARTDRMGSSGMGLAINSSILRLHKAKYKCISNKTETSFWFELKRVK